MVEIGADLPLFSYNERGFGGKNAGFESGDLISSSMTSQNSTVWDRNRHASERSEGWYGVLAAPQRDLAAEVNFVLND